MNIRVSMLAALLFAATIPFTPRSAIRRSAPIIRGYPGELACSTFERLFASQAEQYERATGIAPKTEHDKALASWFWRNTHYCHGEEGADDLWGAGFGKGNDARSREYWTGSLRTDSVYAARHIRSVTAEMEHLLGHGRARGVGVEGHNSFEVFLTGGPYGNGQWALLDHDLSTVIFDREGKRLLSLREVQADWKRLIDQNFLTQKTTRLDRVRPTSERRNGLSTI
jgi:hypothetical protein